MSKREKAIYKRAVKDTLGTIGGILIWTGFCMAFMIKSGIFVF